MINKLPLHVARAGSDLCPSALPIRAKAYVKTDETHLGDRKAGIGVLIPRLWRDRPVNEIIVIDIAWEDGEVLTWVDAVTAIVRDGMRPVQENEVPPDTAANLAA